ncbi:MAG: 50S ribosomal protein L24 [Candidatus Binatia bacterium]
MRAGASRTARPQTSRIRKNDTVMVITGREKGKTGKVLRVVREDNRVVIERLHMVKRHQKPRGQQGQGGGIIEKEASIDLSNVMIMCDRCNAPARLGAKRLDDGSAVRMCRRCGEAIDK